MSYYSDKAPDQCWAVFHRHIDQVPHQGNQDQLHQYLLEREENVSYSTLGNYVQHIKAFGIYLCHRPWLEATRDDIILAIKQARNHQGRRDHGHASRGKPLGRYTKYQRMVMLREFYKWLLETDETPPQFKRMPFKKPSLEDQYQDRGDRLTQEEVVRLLTVARDAMERCLVMFLLDSGFRAGEIQALNLSNITFDEAGATVMHSRHAKGLKTMRRKVPIRITLATPYLRQWIANHPYRLDPDHALFVSRCNRTWGQRLSSGGIWSIIERLSRRAKTRHAHPHMFRHTAASIRSADGWNEEMMRLHFGWTKGSEMPSLYSHVEEDYDAFARKWAGVPLAATPQDPWKATCPACAHENEADAYFCSDCQKPIRSTG